MEYKVDFGRLSKAGRTAPAPAFRLAILGDFSGRANAGVLETGAALAGRKPHKVDVDTLDGLLGRLGITVSVPMDEAGRTVSAPIGSLDDFHPDQLVEALPVFADLLQLRKNLQNRAGFDRAAKEVLSWSGELALPPPGRAAARGGLVATDRKLSDFARLTGRKPSAAIEPNDLIRRLIGPHIVPERDSRQDALVARVDAALSDAMRRLLHHPDFQNAEALWRGLDFLVRRIETGPKLQIVVYDISAEELAADLAGVDALEDSALYALLVEQPTLDAQQGPLSLIAGLYQFEAIPPHAELLGRIASVAAAAGAPFVTGFSPAQLNTPMQDWHPLTLQAWQALSSLPASAYLGLFCPRFLLRMPYGKKTDPIDAFAFEEFTRQSGLSGMLWGHPALLFATAVAESWLRGGAAMRLGSVATIGDLPVYVYNDTDGEQVALPCTERLFTERQAARVATTGVNPIVSLRGRPEVRIGGFKSFSGETLAGRWAPVDIKPTPPAEEPVATESVAAEPDAAEQAVAEPAGADSTESEADTTDGDLDALLASLNADPAPVPADDATDPDLDALLASLK